MNKPFIYGEVDLTHVRLIGEAKGKQVFYGANTCWWTVDPDDLYLKEGTRLPCDPLGGMLMQTKAGDLESFLAQAQGGLSHYGKHGLRTFLLAYHGCVRVVSSTTGQPIPTALKSWKAYEELIDAQPLVTLN